MQWKMTVYAPVFPMAAITLAGGKRLCDTGTKGAKAEKGRPGQ
jgi:hypothetical protein